MELQKRDYNMHHFIYPSQDTYVTNYPDQDVLNYGLDEILRVGTISKISEVIFPTSTFTVNESVYGWCVNSFTGSIISGSLIGTGSLLVGSASFTGSATGFPNVSASFGSFTNFTGSALNFYGTASGFSGKLMGIVYGSYTANVPNQVITSSIYNRRALIQFDITEISRSIAAGDILSPTFTLKMKMAKGETLPITYTVYGFPILEEWVMGNGYESDDGSSTGASWVYRDRDQGTAWTTPGGTYSAPICSQFFNYASGDLKMDVTSIVNSWLAGSPNYGIILVSADELQLSGSGMQLSFFSNDSNTIYRPVLDVSWADSTFLVQSSSTSSISISTQDVGFYGVVSGNAQVTGISISGSFGGIGNIIVDANSSASGLVVGSGSFGFGFTTVYGNVVGLVSQSIVTTYTLRECPPGTFSTSSVTQSILMGIFTDGTFSGSWFTGSWNGYNISNGSLSGSWTSTLLSGSGIISSSAVTTWPTAVSARFTSPYFSGNAIGSVSIVDSSSYGIFTGTLITDINYSILSVVFPFTGSIFSSATSYTSSVVIISSSLEPVQFDKPFTAVIQNLPPTVRAGNIIRINVFGREEFPLKNFARNTQFSQFLTPKYLPVSSSYAIKDNQTEEIIVDFDNYTRLSCDMNGNYFLLDTTGLPQERYFKILIKTEQSGSSYTIDNDNIFKIVR